MSYRYSSTGGGRWCTNAQRRPVFSFRRNVFSCARGLPSFVFRSRTRPHRANYHRPFFTRNARGGSDRFGRFRSRCSARTTLPTPSPSPPSCTYITCLLVARARIRRDERWTTVRGTLRRSWTDPSTCTPYNLLSTWGRCVIFRVFLTIDVIYARNYCTRCRSKNIPRAAPALQQTFNDVVDRLENVRVEECVTRSGTYRV